MNKSIFLGTAMAMLVLTASNALAQTITVTNGQGVAGGQATVDLEWNNNGNDYRTLQFDVVFDKTILPSVDLSVCPVEPYITGYLVSQCVLRAAPDDDTVRYGLVLIAGSIPTGTLGELTFSIDPAASPGTTPLAIENVVIEGDPTPTLNPGEIQILGPAYTSAPPANAPIDLGSVIQNDTDPFVDVEISNTGAVGTSLTVNCGLTGGSSPVFSLSNAAPVIPQGSSANVTVTCDSAGAIQLHTGTLECAHDGDNIASPVSYALSCTITEGPQPAYGSNPAPGAPILLEADFQDVPIPPVPVAITNTGDPGTTLNGNCSITSPSVPGKISVADGGFSLATGATEVQNVSCDSSETGNYTATLSCSHNGSNASPATYPVTCNVGPQRPAVFESDPIPGSTIDLTPTDAVVDEVVPPQTLTLLNTAVPEASDLNINCDLIGGSTPGISVSPDISSGIDIAPDNGSFDVEFSCDTSAVDSYTATYVCDYRTDGSEPPSSFAAEYTILCDVRDAASDVEVSPASGQTQSAEIPVGGSTTFSFDFTEVLDEGAAGSLDLCELDDGSAFTIVSPASFPQDVDAGTTLTVTVEGTDPGGVETVEDILTCFYTDSDDERTEVSWPLVLQIGGVARFEVRKDFVDGNIAEVDVTITCDTGLPLKQTATIAQNDPVVFVVGSFESGTMDCDITEGDAFGYTASYSADGDSASDDDSEGCYFTDISGGNENICVITNTPNPVDITIRKKWEFMESESGVMDNAKITLTCVNAYDSNADFLNGDSVWKWYINGDESNTATIVPIWNGQTSCTVSERVFDSAVESTGCEGTIAVDIGDSDKSCTITNTVFFEGIPTLSQWGMAIMVLLMLGVGMVGFRKFI